MKASGLLGMSMGWLITIVAVAVDVGIDDLIFWPALAMTLPSFLGLFVALRAFRRTKEAVERGRLIGFGVLGAVIAVIGVLLFIGAMYWNRPVPGAQLELGSEDVTVQQ